MATKPKAAASMGASKRPQVFPAGPKGIVQAVATAKRRGEPSITFKLKNGKSS
ncbi:MAG: hypothetical protein WAZ34_16965 [Rhodocyclaceae bacterium]